MTSFYRLSALSAITLGAALSMTAGIALKGPLVNAPSDPAPVVDGDLPVIEEMNSMNSSGTSM